MRLPILLTVLAVLALGCNTADLTYPPLQDSGNGSDSETNDGCLDRCNAVDAGADSGGDSNADAGDTGPAVDSAAEASTDASEDGG